jgi:hypothetical protein
MRGGIDSGNRPIRPRGKNQYNKQKIYTQIFQNIKNFKKMKAVQVGGGFCFKNGLTIVF